MNSVCLAIVSVMVEGKDDEDEGETGPLLRECIDPTSVMVPQVQEVKARGPKRLLKSKLTVTKKTDRWNFFLLNTPSFLLLLLLLSFFLFLFCRSSPFIIVQFSTLFFVIVRILLAVERKPCQLRTGQWKPSPPTPFFDYAPSLGGLIPFLRLLQTRIRGAHQGDGASEA